MCLGFHPVWGDALFKERVCWEIFQFWLSPIAKSHSLNVNLNFCLSLYQFPSCEYGIESPGLLGFDDLASVQTIRRKTRSSFILLEKYSPLCDVERGRKFTKIVRLMFRIRQVRFELPVSVARMLTRCETTRFSKEECAEKFSSFDLAPLQSRTHWMSIQTFVCHSISSHLGNM